MSYHDVNNQPVGEWIDEGRHKSFRANACPLRATDYDESQMRESDAEQRAQRSELLYDC